MMHVKNGDGRTDERTDEQTDLCIELRYAQLIILYVKGDNLPSAFSHLASRSQRPSVFSRLSDFSFTSINSLYEWNYWKISFLVFATCTFMVIVIFILCLIWEKQYKSY